MAKRKPKPTTLPFNVWDGVPSWTKAMQFIFDNYAHRLEVLESITCFDVSTFMGWMYSGNKPSKNTCLRIVRWHSVYEDGEFSPALNLDEYEEQQALYFSKRLGVDVEAHKELINAVQELLNQ